MRQKKILIVPTCMMIIREQSKSLIERNQDSIQFSKVSLVEHAAKSKQATQR